MATIKEKKLSDGSISFRVEIRKKGIQIYKSFTVLEDAELYSFYKERLIENMESFEVPLKDRVTLNQIYELKLKDSNSINIKSHVKMAIEKFNEIFGVNTFCNDISYKDWENSCKILSQSYVYRGAKTENSKRIISLSTLRRYFAYASSCISHAQSLGIELENHPLKVLQVIINPKFL
jgi:hypothetical protein